MKPNPLVLLQKRLRAVERWYWQRVYFVGAAGLGLVKIGTTHDLGRRLPDLQVGSPVRLKVLFELPGDEHLERQLHQQFAADRRHGEWFLLSEPIRSWVKAARQRAERDQYERRLEANRRARKQRAQVAPDVNARVPARSFEFRSGYASEEAGAA